MAISERLEDGLRTGFIDCNLTSLERYHPKLLVNDHKRGMKVLTNIIDELHNCEEFYFSVAFITNSGVTSLINILSEMKERQIKGKIITSQYQNFTQPKALERLLAFENIELRIVTKGNFHGKGYIFKQSDSYSFIVGSSNLTQSALSKNKEWNLKLSSLENGLLMQNIMREFDQTFSAAESVDVRWLRDYTELYTRIRQTQSELRKKVQASASQGNVLNLTQITPNKMQREALTALASLRRDGKQKALLISATATGKTYLSAFDVAVFQPRRFLFLIHRENIARKAMESYKAILGQDLDAGILSGREKGGDATYVFAMIQTLSQDSVLNQFGPEHFDYIVIDEVHRSGAATYQKILEHFKPKFLLGMTATPERTDGFDIFKAFDYNIAYEIRLNQALEEQMLAPFHYFGVSEIQVNGELLDEGADFNRLTSEERVRHIIEKANYYGWDNGRVKGLIFCSRVEEARVLSERFNRRGYATLALDGSSTEEQREEAIRRLEQDQREGGLDYILTVDIFYEGVDIPSVNQIIMLRPTQSAIVFVQQLGRGLRKTEEKDFLTVIDFIGNYANNYLVPIALYGDRSYNKDTIRKLINNGSSTIPGCSTVNFDTITKERIFQSIDETNLSKLKDLKKDYQLLKYQRGSIPSMMDFLNYGQREPYAFVKYSNSYYNFVCKAEHQAPAMNLSKLRLLEFYSKEILNGKRVEEVIILALLVAKGQATKSEVQQIILKNFGFQASEETLQSAVHCLNGSFLTKADRKKYGINPNITVEDDTFRMEGEYLTVLTETVFYDCLNDMIKYAFRRFQLDFEAGRYRDGFLLYQKYSRKDACRILNWEKDVSSIVYGYKIENNTCPIFVTYEKKEDIRDGTKYEDRFVNAQLFSWQTKHDRKLTSKDVVSLQAANNTGMRILLFVKKSDGEGSDFYYMGDLAPAEFNQSEIMDNGRMVPIVDVLFHMKDEVAESMYQYLEG